MNRHYRITQNSNDITNSLPPHKQIPLRIGDKTVSGATLEHAKILFCFDDCRICKLEITMVLGNMPNHVPSGMRPESIHIDLSGDLLKISSNKRYSSVSQFTEAKSIKDVKSSDEECPYESIEIPTIKHLHAKKFDNRQDSAWLIEFEVINPDILKLIKYNYVENELKDLQ